MVLDTIRNTYFVSGALGMLPETKHHFRPIPAFVVITVCATLQGQISVRSVKATRLNKAHEPIRSALEAASMQPIFEQKHQDFMSQSTQRRELLLKIIDQKVRARIDDLDHVLSTANMKVNISAYADGTTGLDDEYLSSDALDDGPQTNPDPDNYDARETPQVRVQIPS